MCVVPHTVHVVYVQTGLLLFLFFRGGGQWSGVNPPSRVPRYWFQIWKAFRSPFLTANSEGLTLGRLVCVNWRIGALMNCQTPKVSLCAYVCLHIRSANKVLLWPSNYVQYLWKEGGRERGPRLLFGEGEKFLGCILYIVFAAVRSSFCRRNDTTAVVQNIFF